MPKSGDDVKSKRHAVGPTGADRGPLMMLWYRIVQIASGIFFAMLWGGLRATGRDQIPREGGVLLISNHTSHFDVFVLGIPVLRPLNYVARSTLFKPGLGMMIRSVGGFPIDREGSGTQGLKEALKRMRNGKVVTFFPEGTRSYDGELGEFHPGVVALATRGRVPIVPVAIVGAYDAWSRHRLLPCRHPIRLHFGPPIGPEELRSLEPNQVVELLRNRVADCLHQARARFARAERDPLRAPSEHLPRPPLEEDETDEAPIDVSSAPRTSRKPLASGGA